jgi:hypothetical protein
MDVSGAIATTEDGPGIVFGTEGPMLYVLVSFVVPPRGIAALRSAATTSAAVSTASER